MKSREFFLTFLFLLLIGAMLFYPEQSLYYSMTGLTLWFQKMIPALFPFMIISGIMVRLNLTEKLASVFMPILYPLFRLSPNGIYCIVMGFLCGFPMGAKVIGDLYIRNRLSYAEASYLLAFCNHIGPIYFVSFVLPLLGRQKPLPYLIGMYGIPAVYGLILRHTVYKQQIFPYPLSSAAGQTERSIKQSLSKPLSVFFVIDDSILSAIENITRLGGYMVLFNLFNLVPAVCCGYLPFFRQQEQLLLFLNGVLEITSGINRIGGRMPLLVLLILPFGGISCIAQTYSVLKKTNLSIYHYILHKLILTVLTGIYYGLWFFLFPKKFLC